MPVFFIQRVHLFADACQSQLRVTDFVLFVYAFLVDKHIDAHADDSNQANQVKNPVGKYSEEQSGDHDGHTDSADHPDIVRLLNRFRLILHGELKLLALFFKRIILLKSNLDLIGVFFDRFGHVQLGTVDCHRLLPEILQFVHLFL